MLLRSQDCRTQFCLIVLFYILGCFMHDERAIDCISITESGSHSCTTFFLAEVKPRRDAVSCYPMLACRRVGCCMVFCGDESSYMSRVTDNLEKEVCACVCISFSGRCNECLRNLSLAVITGEMEMRCLAVCCTDISAVP